MLLLEEHKDIFICDGWKLKLLSLWENHPRLQQRVASTALLHQQNLVKQTGCGQELQACETHAQMGQMGQRTMFLTC